MGDDVVWLDATGQAEAVRRGEVSSRELVERAIAGIEEYNPALNAVIHGRFERALVEADTVDGSGPFAGVPFLVKDLLAHAAGDPFHEGIRPLAERRFVDDADTDLVRRFRSAGLITVGRTNTSELGLLPTTEPRSYGPTRNPWDLQRSPLGSGGGSAAAVAAGLVPMAHSNDAGGSIRLPASACGLVGLKPSRGRVSLGPDFGDLASGTVAEFVITRSVRDAARLLDWLCSPPAIGEPYVASPIDGSFVEACARTGSRRVGMLTGSPGARVAVNDDCVRAVHATARLLEDLGHHVEDDAPGALHDEGFLQPATVIVPFAFTAFALDWWERRIGTAFGEEDLEPWTWLCAQRGRRVNAGQYLSAVEWIQSWTRRVVRWWENFDVLVTPTVAFPPPTLPTVTDPDDPRLTGQRAGEISAFTYPFNMTGQPAMSLPLHHANGLPIGVQLVAAPGREDTLLGIAKQLEESEPWAQRTPVVGATA